MRANSSLCQSDPETTSACAATPSGEGVDASFGPSAVLRTVWTSHGEADASPPLAHTRRSRAHTLAASATTIHVKGNFAGTRPRPDCSVIPGTPSPEQSGQIPGGFHERIRQTTPDCVSARLPGELDDVEAVVAHAEGAASVSAAANASRRDPVELPGAIRWVQGRVRLVHAVLSLLIGLLPEQLERCVAEVGAVRARLATDSALVALRALTAKQLPALPAPLGFHPRRREMTIRSRRFQHKVGADPPARPA